MKESILKIAKQQIFVCFEQNEWIDMGNREKLLQANGLLLKKRESKTSFSAIINGA